MSHSLSRRSSLIAFCALVSFSACDGAKPSNAPPATAPAGVEASYQELAGAFAACGQQLTDCLDQASDGASRFQCRADFERCRRDAGKQALQAMIAAIHQCIDTAKQCKHGGDEDAGISVSGHQCRKELWACIWQSRHGDDDADAGGDDDSDDCIKGLHNSLWGGHSPFTCASRVRQCVSDAMPDPGDVDSDDDHHGSNNQGHNDNDNDADAGSDEGHGGQGGTPAASHGRACLIEYGACLRQRRGVRACVEGLRACAHPAAR